MSSWGLMADLFVKVFVLKGDSFLNKIHKKVLLCGMSERGQGKLDVQKSKFWRSRQVRFLIQLRGCQC